MSLKGRMLIVVAMAALASTMDVNRPRPVRYQKREEDPGPKKKIIPNGCKEYFFDSGFVCIANNEKKARRKYEKWKKLQEAKS